MDKYHHCPYRAAINQKNPGQSGDKSPQWKTQQPLQAPVPPTRSLPSYKAQALAQVWKTCGVKETHAHLWVPSKTLPPITSQVMPPLFVQWTSPVDSLFSHHSANSRTSQGLRWLLAVLEWKLTTSWDMVPSGRFWWSVVL